MKSLIKKRLYILLCLLSIQLIAQDNCYTVIGNEVIIDNDHEFRIYSMVVDSCERSKIKSTYIAQDAFEKFKALNDRYNILLVASASYSSSIYDSISKPVGFCSEKGRILNKMPSSAMDGLVMLNAQDESKNFAVIDLEVNPKYCKLDPCNLHVSHLNIRENASDTYKFINFVERENMSCFQTHLLYSHHKTYDDNFKRLTIGTSDRGRRFLVICEKDNVLYHLVVDHISGDYLMEAAKRSFDYINDQDYNIQFILNLDTGNKDILHAYNGERLENMRPNPRLNSATLEHAISLVIYYTEK